MENIVKTSPAKVKAEFESRGLSIREWAKRKGFSERLVYLVLSGKSPARRGESFRIAVELGLRATPPIEETPSYLVDTRGSPSRTPPTEEHVMK